MDKTIKTSEKVLEDALVQIKARLEDIDMDDDTYDMHVGFYSALVWVKNGAKTLPLMNEMENAWMLE